MTDFTIPPQDTPDVWERIAAAHRPVVLYGMGNGADKLAECLAALGVPVAAVMASDGFVRGQSFRGFRVRTWEDVQQTFPSPWILVAFGTRLSEVMRDLLTLAEENTVRLPDMPVAGETFFDGAFYRQHYHEFLQAGEILADETSRALFSSVLQYKLTGELSPLTQNVTSEADICALLPTERIRRAMDGGAYNGDTVRQMMAYFPALSEVLAVEPDEKTFRRLSAFASACPIRVIPVAAALGAQPGRAVLHASGNRNSALAGASYRHTDREVLVCTVDELCQEFSPDYIKLDVEGAESETLIGAKETIRRDRPILRIAGYHRPEDMFRLPLFLRESYPFYRLYFRRTPCFPAWEADFIAIPT